MQHTEYTLPNGLTVILVDTKSFPSATALLLVKSGSRYEHANNNGIAHFFEHMVFKGSKRFPDAFTLSSTIEGFGGVFNAFTGKDKTGYWIKAPLEHIPLSLTVIADMIQHSQLSPEEIEKEKGVIIEEMRMYEDTPAQKVSELYERTLYAGHPLGMDIVGTEETVRSFTRDVFTQYMDALYKPNNAVLVVAGGLEGKLEELKGHIAKEFAAWSQGSVEPHSEFQPQGVTKHIAVFQKATEQAHLVVGYPTVSLFHDDYVALQLLSIILGGGMSSKLFMEVREKRGLCYYIGASQDSYADTGDFSVQAGVTVEKEKVQEAVHAIRDVLYGKDIAIEPQDIQRAKDLIRGRTLLGLENSYAVAQFFGVEQLMKGSIRTPQDVLAQFDAVTAEDIERVRKSYLIDNAYTLALVGPFTQSDMEAIL